jgi:predicted dehydrogenase
MSLQEPVDIALIGTGHRSQTVYQPLFESLKPWVRLVAVCDPVREHADAYAEHVGAKAFYSIQELVQSQSVEAALIVAPIDLHHAMSCYLSQHGIHNLVETSMCYLLVQGQEMVSTAREHKVVFRVAENFFRFPFDRIAKKIAETGFLGPIKRLTCFHDHTGFHNNSRWIKFYGVHPESVQSIEHSMPVTPHYEAPHRFHTDEKFRARFFIFPDNCLVTDIAGNIKGMLGRYNRPGYTEFDGARGTIVHYPRGPRGTIQWDSEAEVRYCSDEALNNRSIADQIFSIVHETDHNGHWNLTYVDLPTGRVEYRPHPVPDCPYERKRHYYAGAVMGHIVDFASAIRKGTPSEYTDGDALMALMMEIGAHESALLGGERLGLPLTGDLEGERHMRELLKKKLGVDPLDIEGMLNIAVPRP